MTPEGLVILDPPERSRKYVYPGYQTLKLENVTGLEVRQSGKHYVECANGRKYFVSPGWLWIELDVDKRTV